MGADVECVYFAEQVFFHLCVELVGMVIADVAEQSFFADGAALLEVAADADSDYEWGTSVCSGLFDYAGYPVDYLRFFSGGVEHLELALVFAASAFGHDGDVELVGVIAAVMDYAGGVCLCVGSVF